jgi:mono/diheme cytochrome c family protein
MRKLWVAALLVCFAVPALADDSAEDVWMARCKGCHGADGKAHTKIGQKEKIDDFTSAKWQAEMSDKDIKDVITNGSKKEHSKMKAFKDKLTPGEIDSLIPYIRAMKGK